MVRILPSSEAQPERRGPENQATVANSSSEPGSSEATGSSGHRLQERPALQIFKQQASTELPLRLQVPNYVNSSHEEIGGDFSQGVSRPSHVPEEEGLAMVRQNSSKLRGKVSRRFVLGWAASACY